MSTMQLCAHFVGGEDIFLSLTHDFCVHCLFLCFYWLLSLLCGSRETERLVSIDPQPMKGRYIVIGDDDDNWWRHVISGTPRDITIIL